MCSHGLSLKVSWCTNLRSTSYKWISKQQGSLPQNRSARLCSLSGSYFSHLSVAVSLSQWEGVDIDVLIAWITLLCLSFYVASGYAVLIWNSLIATLHSQRASSLILHSSDSNWSLVDRTGHPWTFQHCMHFRVEPSLWQGRWNIKLMGFHEDEAYCYSTRNSGYSCSQSPHRLVVNRSLHNRTTPSTMMR